jgi:hypothetical protein
MVLMLLSGYIRRIQNACFWRRTCTERVMIYLIRNVRIVSVSHLPFASIIRKVNVYGSVHRKYIPIYVGTNRFECAVGGVRHPQHTQTGSNTSTIAADSGNGVTNTRCCRYSCMRSWWWVEVPPKHVEQFQDINKLCNVASCWIYIGILLGAHYILRISRIRVNVL